MTSKSPELLTAEQRLFFTQIPHDLPDKDIARYYTLSDEDLAVIRRQHGTHNRLGFAVQLCVLRYPGRPLTDLFEIPQPVLSYIAEQVDVDANTFIHYGRRENTIHEHLERIRQEFGFRNYGRSEMLAVARHLLPQALENHRHLPLIHSALTFLRERQIIAPGMSAIERLVWGVGRIANRWITQWMTEDLSAEQRHLLDNLLRPDPDIAGHTRLSWLRAAPAAPSSRHLNSLLDRSLFVSGLRLPPIPLRMQPNRLRDLARQCSRYSAQALAHLHSPAWRYTLLRAHLSALGSDLCDDALDMLDRFHGDLLQKGERQQERAILRSAREIHRDLHILATAAEALLRARAEELNPFETVFAEVDEETLAATVASAREAARPADLDYLDLVEQRYVRRRQALLRLYQSLHFQAVLGHNPALDALEHVRLLEAYGKRVRAVEQAIDGRYVQAPLEHLGRTRWRKHALHYHKINPNYYEMAAFDRLRAGLRSGDIIVSGSRRYRDFDSYLIPRPQWEVMRAAGQTGLAITGSAHDYLEMINRETEESAARLLAALPDNDSLSVDERGLLRLRQLEKAAPSEAETLRRQLYDLLPLIQLPDLLIEVDAWTGFFDQLVHLTTGEPVSRERKLALIATVMALGMNIGLEKMPQATAFSYGDFSWAEDWLIREETLVPALAVLDNFVLPLPLAQVWGGGSSSSSDAIRIPVGVSSAHADYHPHQLAWRRGVSVVTHVADIGMPFGSIAISAANREALHVVDALCHHEADLNIEEHFTDQGGASFHVFALCRLLGPRFIPNLRDMDEQILHTTRDVVLPPPLSHLQRPVRTTRLVSNWDEMLRTSASILHGAGSAALIMGKLASYPRQNALAGAFGDMGKLERTPCILNLLCDEAMRRRVRVRLNWHESHNSLARALFIGQQGEFRDRSFQDQFHRASCLMLLTAAISAWNTVYLQRAIDALQALDVEIPVDLLQHVAPFGWEHINLLGRYDFDPRQARTLDNPRDLRLRGLLLEAGREHEGG